MDTKESPVGWNSNQGSEMDRPLIPLQQNPPEYTDAVFPAAQGCPNTSGHPVYLYGAPVVSALYPQGSYLGQPVVTMQPTVQVVAAPLANPLPDYLCYSIFTMLCCCLPLGSAALVYSITTRDANMFGHQQIASRNSRMARILNNVSVGVGLGLCLLMILYVIVVVNLATNRYRP